MRAVWAPTSTSLILTDENLPHLDVLVSFLLALLSGCLLLSSPS